MLTPLTMNMHLIADHDPSVNCDPPVVVLVLALGFLPAPPLLVALLGYHAVPPAHSVPVSVYPLTMDL